ncbi:DNA cytosine methyltransferase [Halopseudomonas oceani]|uniref:Cytosine-specific methyltransferase n=1 Tax=Halopseudomonas oceani TaxID=1708783 RepID=A0A2P4EQE3_9GAMM|nr:DNA cytosine methyltransferase [Halopseudomonas oceani]POB00837.1 DNA (cytosine-5-)-methyltransferase [Halopseudomonas oceani]
MTKKRNNVSKHAHVSGRKSDVLACDLFAGAGGFSLGAYQAGVKVAAAVEWNKHACATYRSNLIESKLTTAQLFEDDITALDPHVVRKMGGFDEFGCDILLGGPPCQGFSAHRIKDAGVNDPRNELLLRYFEYVRVLRPTFFLVENVPGLLWPRHEKHLEAFYALAASAEYGVLEPQILNARDYGVPQSRRRVFILGYDKKKLSGPPAWPPAATHAAPDAQSDLPAWVSAAVAFKMTPSEHDPNDIHMQHGQELLDAFKRTPPNGGSRSDSGRVLPCHETHSGHRDVYGRIDPSRPGPTMTTACINPSKGRFVHPTEHHGITLRQAARLQSFPDWYNFEGGLMAGGMQVGNAVPVELARVLLEPLRKAALAARAKERVAEVA